MNGDFLLRRGNCRSGFNGLRRRRRNCAALAGWRDAAATTAQPPPFQRVVARAKARRCRFSRLAVRAVSAIETLLEADPETAARPMTRSLAARPSASQVLPPSRCPWAPLRPEAFPLSCQAAEVALQPAPGRLADVEAASRIGPTADALAATEGVPSGKGFKADGAAADVLGAASSSGRRDTVLRWLRRHGHRWRLLDRRRRQHRRRRFRPFVRPDHRIAERGGRDSGGRHRHIAYTRASHRSSIACPRTTLPAIPAMQ